MENPRVMCHYIKTRTSEDQISKMHETFRNQGWELISVISNSDQVIDGYFFQRN